MNTSDKWREQAANILDNTIDILNDTRDKTFVISRIAQSLSDAFKQGLEQRAQEFDQIYKSMACEIIDRDVKIYKAQSLAGDAWPSEEQISSANWSAKCEAGKKNLHGYDSGDMFGLGFEAAIAWLKDWKTRAR